MATQPSIPADRSLSIDRLPLALADAVTDLLEETDLIRFSETQRGIYDAYHHPKCSACTFEPLSPQDVFYIHEWAVVSTRFTVFEIHRGRSFSLPNDRIRLAPAIGDGLRRPDVRDAFTETFANTLVESGLSLLALAVARRRRDVVDILLRYGADPNYGGYPCKLSPLDYAKLSACDPNAMMGADAGPPEGEAQAAVAMAETLLRAGATFTHRDVWDLILWSGRADLVRLAAANGAEHGKMLHHLYWCDGKNQPVFRGVDALTSILYHPYHAVIEGRVSGAVIQTIVNVEPVLMNHRDSFGRTVIHQAMCLGMWTLVEGLIRLPSTASPIANDAGNPLNIALWLGKTAMAVNLMDRPEYDLHEMHNPPVTCSLIHKKSVPLMVAIECNARSPLSLRVLATHRKMALPFKGAHGLDIKACALQMAQVYRLAAEDIALIESIPQR